MNKLIIVDRTEGDFAVCEIDGSTKDIPLVAINGIVHEGDVLRDNGDDTYSVDIKETSNRRSHIQSRFDAIKSRKKHM